VHLVFYFSGLRPRVLGIDHAIGAVPRGRLGDGCVCEDVVSSRNEMSQGLSLGRVYGN
jgi:hypothetical protein